jgi:hypothetical protein
MFFIIIISFFFFFSFYKFKTSPGPRLICAGGRGVERFCREEGPRLHRPAHCRPRHRVSTVFLLSAGRNGVGGPVCAVAYHSTVAPISTTDLSQQQRARGGGAGGRSAHLVLAKIEKIKHVLREVWSS